MTTPPPGTPLHREDERALCHALCVRTATPLDAGTLRRRLTDAVGSDERVWEEHVPAPAADSERHRTREATRPLAPGQSLRTVLLRYGDGLHDLILVTRRTVLDRAGLHRLAAVLLGDSPSAPVSLVARDGTAHGKPGSTDFPAPVSTEPAPWWVSDSSAPPGLIAEQTMTGAMTGATTGSPAQANVRDLAASWLAATAVTLARHGVRRPALAVLDAPGAASGGTGPAAARLVETEPASSATLADLTTRVGATLAEAHAVERQVDAAVVLDMGMPEAPPSDATLVEYVPYQTPPCPLTFSVQASADGTCTVRLRHRPYDLAPASARALLERVVGVHERLLAEPSSDPDTVDVLDEAGRQDLLRIGRTERLRPRRHLRIEQLFAQWVAAQPDAVALTSQGKRLSYRDLDRWSDVLAQGLRERGVRPGDRVGVCCERSAELVAVLISVLKAGACHVPVDVRHPVDRRAYVAADAELALVVTTLTDFGAGPDVRTLTPGELEEAGRNSTASPGSATTTGQAADPAYVIYTSGTTGRPKGVTVPHQNVVDLVDATAPLFGLGPADVWTLFHSSAFDFSVWEIWGCLLTGGHLVVVPYWGTRSPEQFHDVLRAERVTVLSQTPSAFGQLVEAQRERAEDLSVRLVVLGGESLDARLLLPWFDRYPETVCRVVNMFGITETTVHVTAEGMTRAAALARSRVVGRALPGWSVRVLDEHGRMVPAGVPGEIHVAGAGVTLGYLHRPELTGQRFLPDPYGEDRLYRSGDRGRLLPDGRLEHLGRLDDQVKVRGFRIELGEIRAVLLEAPGVVAAAAVVSTPPGQTADSRIDAYVVLEPTASETGLRDRVARVLPDYMVPATITRLPALPLTVNGKLDVAALPAPAARPTAVAEGGTGDDALDDLLTVWREVLGAAVGPDDDFFEQGGNSLVAVRLGAALRERGYPPLHPRTLYLNPTPRRVVRALLPDGR
ncbi:amino acid adenylation domain-containing protein [Streptomyces sp. NPDC056373]|uniref:amino acid adenylation domain-containing protein n=1 Tax=Streptomyces sp. NPDC056373 TaxID=3345798 RepID=UPI0035D6E285